LDFFEAQELARRATRRLVLLYLLAVAAVAIAVCLGLGTAYTLAVMSGAAAPAREVMIDGRHLGSAFVEIMRYGVPLKLYAFGAGATLLVIASATLYRVFQLSDGGEAVVDMVGARRVDSASTDPGERRLLNVVEEMAIASGVHVPSAYVMDGERGINAFAAGYSPNEAVVAVTRGALDELSRDELQGVIGHEFSHILNGDMRLNVRLLGVLFGIVCIGQFGQFLIRSTAYRTVRVSRENRGPEVALVFLGIALALIGFLGLEFARLIKAAISRQREFLADASSVQFTRNPDGIAGALDTIADSQRTTLVHNAHAEELSHMFFVQGVANWMGGLFDTHPPIEERIRRVRPGFQRSRYRAARAAVMGTGAPPVAVLDGAGNVVKTIGGGGRWAAGDAARATAAVAAVAASVGNPTAAHVDFAQRLLAAIPPALREKLSDPAGAQEIVFALAIAGDDASRTAKLGALRARRGDDVAHAVEQVWGVTSRLDRGYALPLLSIVSPVLRQLAQPQRDALVADVAKVVEADSKVTLAEFVLATILRQQLREGAGNPIPTRYRALSEVDGDLRMVLSLVAHAALADTAQAYAKGAEYLSLNVREPVPPAELSTGGVGEALERLRLLAPLAKPRVIKACLEVASADNVITLAQAELTRMVAATLDCPLPPVLATLDPATLK
jgi:Zn-dependent protease with chaperone function